MSLLSIIGAGAGFFLGGPAGAAAGYALGSSADTAGAQTRAANRAIDAQQQATQQQYDLSREAFDWYKQEYARTQPTRDKAEALSGEIAQTQLTGMRTAMGLAEDQAAYGKTFRPVEQAIVRKAMEYDTPERRNAEAGRAMAGVQQQADAQQGIQMRRDMSMGINPNDRKFLANSNGIRVALAKAGAADTARRTIEAGGTARMMDAAALGRGVVSNQATMLGAATNSGNSAMANTVSGVNVANSGTPLMTQGFNTAINGAGTAASNYAQMANVFNNQAGAAVQGFGNFMQGMSSLGWKPLG
jgi:hypothetical protein